MLGESGAGKTSLCDRIARNKFSDTYISSIGVDFILYSVRNEKNEIVKVTLWDTAGQERFKAISKNFYKNADAVILVFDLSDIKSFTKIEMWLTEVLKNTYNDDIKFILIGTKSDKYKMVKDTMITEFKKKHNLDYYELSSKKDDRTIIIKPFNKLAVEVNAKLPIIKDIDTDINIKPDKPVKIRCC